MNGTPSILVASDVADDARVVERMLREEFDLVHCSSDPDRATADFEQYRPDVLILAFDELERAERYYLGLYRLSTKIHSLPHRTVILCNKDDVRHVYALCKRQHFDDYVLFWPMGNDAPRLLMATHHALRQLAPSTADVPSVYELARQARKLGSIESELQRQAGLGVEQMALASESLQRAEQGIGTAVGNFSRKLVQDGLRGMIDVKDEAEVGHEYERLKSELITTHLAAVAESMQAARQCADELKGSVATQLDAARELRSLADRVLPLVLVVDDDPFQHKLLRGMLSQARLELGFAESGIDALTMLRKRRPELILMDVDLPDMNGIETARRIRATAAYKGVPIVMITSQAEKDVVVSSVTAGAVGFLVKPIQKDVLFVKLGELLDGGLMSAAAPTAGAGGASVRRLRNAGTKVDPAVP